MKKNNELHNNGNICDAPQSSFNTCHFSCAQIAVIAAHWMQVLEDIRFLPNQSWVSIGRCATQHAQSNGAAACACACAPSLRGDPQEQCSPSHFHGRFRTAWVQGRRGSKETRGTLAEAAGFPVRDLILPKINIVKVPRGRQTVTFSNP